MENQTIPSFHLVRKDHRFHLIDGIISKEISFLIDLPERMLNCEVHIFQHFLNGINLNPGLPTRSQTRCNILNHIQRISLNVYREEIFSSAKPQTSNQSHVLCIVISTIWEFNRTSLGQPSIIISKNETSSRRAWVAPRGPAKI